MPIPHNNIICVTKDEVTRAGANDYTVSSGIRDHRKGKVTCWPHHKEGKTIYLHYDGLKPEYRQLIKDKLCGGLEPAEYLKNQALIKQADTKQAETEALELVIINSLEKYAPYLKYYENFKLDQAKKAAVNCAAIVAGAHYMALNGIKPNSLTFYKKLGEIFEKYDQKPTNERRLAEKIKAYVGGTPVNELVTVPRAGNNNRALYRKADANTIEVIRGWMVQLMDGHNYSDATIIRAIAHNCELSGFEVIPSKSTLQNWVNAKDLSFLTANARYSDNNRFSRKYNAVNHFERPLFANDVWQMDGTRINMIPHKAVAKNGDKKEAFLYIITVFDAHSGDILGDYYGYNESRWAYAAALQAACTNTGALPHTLVLDRFPGHNTQEWQHLEATLKEKYAVKVIYTSKSTGKAQVERSFGTLQSVFMCQSDYYYGEGVKSTRPSAHRTEEYIKKAIKEAKNAGFDIEKAIEESFKVVNAYRTTPLNTYSRKYAKIEQSPAQLWQRSDKPNQMALQPIDLVKLFWLRRKITFSQQLFSLEIMREACYYPVSEFEFVKNNTGVTFEVRYDPFDLSQIYVFDMQTGAFVRTVNRHTPVIGYGPDANYKKHAALRSARAAIETTRKVERAKMIEAAPEVKRPALPEPDYTEFEEVAALTPHQTKAIKEHAESDYLLNAFGYEKQKDVWEREADNIRIPGIDY